MAGSNSVDAIIEALRGVGFDPKMNAVTVPWDDTIPHTVPLVPMMPGVVLKPKDRELTEEERAHEGAHVTGGIPTAVAGTWLSKMLGLGGAGNYLAPDELMSYFAQPNSPATDADLKTIQDLAEKGQGNELYRMFAAKLAEMRRGK